MDVTWIYLEQNSEWRTIGHDLLKYDRYLANHAR